MTDSPVRYCLARLKPGATFYCCGQKYQWDNHVRTTFVLKQDNFSNHVTLTAPGYGHQVDPARHQHATEVRGCGKLHCDLDQVERVGGWWDEEPPMPPESWQAYDWLKHLPKMRPLNRLPI